MADGLPPAIENNGKAMANKQGKFMTIQLTCRLLASALGWRDGSARILATRWPSQGQKIVRQTTPGDRRFGRESQRRQIAQAQEAPER